MRWGRRRQATEWRILVVRPRGRALVRPAVFLVIVTAVAAYFGAQLADPLQVQLVGAGAAVLVVFLSVLPALDWLGTRYVLTNRRVVVFGGPLGRRRAECAVDGRLEVSVERRFVQKLTRCADLVLWRDGERIVVLRDVPDPLLVGEVVVDAAGSAADALGTARASATDVTPWPTTGEHPGDEPPGQTLRY